jgi:endonuclease G
MFKLLRIFKLLRYAFYLGSLSYIGVGHNWAHAETSAAGFEQCASLFPNSVPIDLRSVSPQWRPTALCSNNFTLISSGLFKTPLLVIERLNRGLLKDAKDEERTDEFYPDPRRHIGERAELSDYRRNEYRLDRGHLASAADQPDQASMIQSFALSNMVFCCQDLFVFDRT